MATASYGISKDETMTASQSLPHWTELHETEGLFYFSYNIHFLFTSFLTSSVVGFLKLLFISHFLSQFLYSKLRSSDKFLSFTSSFAMIQSELFLLISDRIFWLNVNFSLTKSFTKLLFSPKRFSRSCAVFVLNA